MVDQPFPNLIAVDIGNSRIKLGSFDRALAFAEATGRPDPVALPEPTATLEIPLAGKSGEFDSRFLDDWLATQSIASALWLVSSVHRGATGRLTAAVDRWSDRVGETHVAYQLTTQDIPLAIRVEKPERVGMDRLVGAVAANRLRRPKRAAIVIDLGTAVTVDRIDADGAFAGGAILPGIAMAARALHDHTDALPHLPVALSGAPPAALGKSTEGAIEAGLFWGTVGAVHELIQRLSESDSAEPDIMVTGGDSAVLAKILLERANQHVRHVPHLVLSGIAVVDAASRPRPAAEATAASDHA